MILLTFVLNQLFDTAKERAEFVLFGIGLIPLALSTFAGSTAFVVTYILFSLLFVFAQLVAQHWEKIVGDG
jgi:hypothetical protein